MPLLPPIITELRANASEFHAELDKASAHLEKLSKDHATTGEKMKAGLGAGFLAVGGFAAGAGMALEHLGQQAESAHLLLETAVTNSGHDMADFSKQIDTTVSHMEHYGHTTSDTQEALAKLTNATQDPAKALKDMGLVAEIAATQHISLTDASDKMVKAIGGSSRLFKAYGIDVKTAGDGTAALAAATDPAAAKAAHLAAAFDELGTRLKGNADAQTTTFGGHIAELRAKLTDMAASIGQKVGPALSVAGPLLMGVAGIVKMEVTPALIGMTSAALAVVAPLAVIAVAAKGLYDAFNSHPKAIVASAQAMHDMTQGAMQEMIAKAGEAHKANSDLFAAPDMQKNFNNAMADSVDTAQRFIDAMQASGINVDAYREQLARKAQADGFVKYSTDQAAAADKAAADAVAAKTEADKAATAELKTRGKEIDTITDKYGLYTGELMKATDKDTEALKTWQTNAAATESAVKSGFKGMEDALSSFSGKANVTADEVYKSFQKQISDANNWAHTLRDLIDAGVDNSILAPLEAAGPKAGGYAQGLLDLVKQKGIVAVNDMGTNVGRIEDTISTYAIDHQTLAENAGKAWNDAIRRGMAYKEIGFSTSGTGLGGGVATSFKVKAFADGGWVDAPKGQAVPAIVHGGEFVLSADMLNGRSGGSSAPSVGGTTINITVQGHAMDVTQLAELIRRQFLISQRSLTTLGFQ